MDCAGEIEDIFDLCPWRDGRLLDRETANAPVSALEYQRNAFGIVKQ